MTSSQEQITAFLKKFKQVLAIPGSFVFIPRSKNLNTLALLGITVTDIRQLLSEITFKDYVSGPDPDRDKQGRNIWEFGLLINGQSVYIKFSDDFSFGKVKCISFHIAEYEIKYPYRSNSV